MGLVTVGVAPRRQPEPYGVAVVAGLEEADPDQCCCEEPEEPRWKWYEFPWSIWQCETCTKQLRYLERTEYFEVRTLLTFEDSPKAATRVVEIWEDLGEHEVSRLMYVDVTGRGLGLAYSLAQKGVGRLLPVSFKANEWRVPHLDDGPDARVDLGTAVLAERFRELVPAGRLRLPKTAEATAVHREFLELEEGKTGSPLVTALGLAVQLDMYGKTWRDERNMALRLNYRLRRG